MLQAYGTHGHCNVLQGVNMKTFHGMGKQHVFTVKQGRKLVLENHKCKKAHSVSTRARTPEELR
jgi:hypothetical protein